MTAFGTINGSPRRPVLVVLVLVLILILVVFFLRVVLVLVLILMLILVVLVRVAVVLVVLVALELSTLPTAPPLFLVMDWRCSQSGTGGATDFERPEASRF